MSFMLENIIVINTMFQMCTKKYIMDYDLSNSFSKHIFPHKFNDSMINN